MSEVVDYFPEYDKNAGNKRLSDEERLMECVTCEFVSKDNLKPQEAIDLLRFAFPKEITKPVTEEVISKAVKSLEKQIPKVPCYSGNGYYYGEMVIDTWECPCCGKQYEVDCDDYEYCPNCGQHIDHSTLTEDD